MSRAIILPDRRVYAVSKAEERGQRRWRQSGPCLPSSASPASQSASQNAAADVLRPSRGVSESSRQPAVRPSSRRGDCRQGIKSRTAPANRRPIWPSARASVLGLQNLAHLEVSRIEPFACLGRQCICRAECACHSCSDPGFPSAACRFSLRQLSCFVSPPPFCALSFISASSSERPDRPYYVRGHLPAFPSWPRSSSSSHRLCRYSFWLSCLC